MRRHRVPLLLAVFAVVACCAWAPWVQVSASGSTSLGFAPVWTSGFRYFPGARVDVAGLATHVALALIFAASIGLGRALRRAE